MYQPVLTHGFFFFIDNFFIALKVLSVKEQT